MENDTTIRDPLETPSSSVPAWLIAAVLVLTLGVLAMTGLVLYSVFSVDDTPKSVAERDVIFYRDLVANKPDSIEARIGLVGAYIAAEMFDEALQEIEVISASDRHKTSALILEARVLRLQGRYDESLAALDQFAEIMPLDFMGLFERGLVQEALGDTEGAIDSFSEAVDIRPDAADARVALALNLEAAGQTDRAVDEYRRALEFIPDYAPALEALQRLGAE